MKNISELIKKRDASRAISNKCKEFLEVLKKHPFQDTYTQDLISKVEWYGKKADGDSRLASMEVNEIIEETRRGCKHPELILLKVDGATVYECTNCHSIIGEVPDGSKVVGSDTYKE